MAHRTTPFIRNYIHIERGPGPAVPDGLGRIPVTRGRIGDSRQEGNEMEPGQLGIRLLPNLKIGAHLGKVLHVFKVPTGKSFHLREGVTQVICQAINHPCPPSLSDLPLKNLCVRLIQFVQAPLDPAPAGDEEKDEAEEKGQLALVDCRKERRSDLELPMELEIGDGHRAAAEKSRRSGLKPQHHHHSSDQLDDAAEP